MSDLRSECCWLKTLRWLLGTQQTSSRSPTQEAADPEQSFPDVPAIIVSDVKLPRGWIGLGLLAKAQSIDRDLASHSDYGSWRTSPWQ